MTKNDDKNKETYCRVIQSVFLTKQKYYCREATYLIN